MTEIVELDRLRKVFPGGVIAVEDLSLRIREGEFVTLLGPSGCGKTTTLRMIAGFETPDRGRILLGGRDVTDDPPYKRAVNTVFQDYALFPHMNVARNVGYGLRIAGVPRDETARRVTEALRMVDLADKAEARPAQLSGGQRQRVGLARAIIRRPKVLLLDEPLSALDVKLREAMQVELKHLHQKLGITFLLVTHDQKEALALSDRVVVMERGRIAQVGTPTELYDHPASAYVADFVGTSNKIRGRVTACAADGVTVSAGQVSLRASRNGAMLVQAAPVLLSIRPERVALSASPPASGEANVIDGRIIERFFLGNVVRLGVDIGQPDPFLVDVLLQRTMGLAEVPEPGAQVWLAIDRASISVFPDDAAR
jgi:spermidine/putrescine ABC transporter ATP-binding subunit